jgi:hypothetical protein
MPRWVRVIGDWFEAGKWVPLAALAVALAALAWGVGGLWRQGRFLATAAGASAQVVGVQDIVERSPHQARGGVTKRQRWVVRGRFTPANGPEVEFTQTWVGLSPGLAEGETCGVAYDPSDPAGTARFLVGTRGLAVPALVAAGALAVLLAMARAAIG